MVICTHCQRSYVSSKTLAKHQNSAIFCLTIQGRQDRIDQILRINGGGVSHCPLLLHEEWQLRFNFELINQGVRPAHFLKDFNLANPHRRQHYERFVLAHEKKTLQKLITTPVIERSSKQIMGLLFTPEPLPSAITTTDGAVIFDRKHLEVIFGDFVPTLGAHDPTSDPKTYHHVRFCVTRESPSFWIPIFEWLSYQPFQKGELERLAEGQLKRIQAALPNETCFINGLARDLPCEFLI